MIRLVVPQVEVRPRLDQFLAKHEPAVSRRRWAEQIRTGRVTVNGKPVRPSAPLNPGDVVEAEAPSEVQVSAIPVDLDIIHEDPQIVVINKPAGLQVQPSKHEARSVVSALLARYKHLPSQGGAERAGIVHRLDEGVSGVMVAARTEEAMVKLYKLFKFRLVEKVYVAWVHGAMKDAQMKIELPLAMHRREWKGGVSKKRGKPAVTMVKRVKVEGERTLVEARPITGRPHQIRIHLSAAGHPIVGDQTYGSSEKLDRILLHAWKITFVHPGSGRKVTFEAPRPW
jgi:23S rRNA pseudouridine1911/1915/1917 synthase